MSKTSTILSAKHFTMLQVLLLKTLLMMTLALLGAAQISFSENEEKVLERIIVELEKGISTGDKTIWQQYMADDGILINRDGKPTTKEEILKEIVPQSKGRMLEIVPVNLKIYLKDSTALTTYIADEKLTIFGQKVDTKYPSVMYFEKRNGQWYMTFFTYFELPVDPPPVRVSTEYLQKFTGIYEISSDLKIEVSTNDTALVYKKVGGTGAGTVLYPIDNNGHFFRAGTESEFIFGKDEQGRSTLRQRRNWIDLVWYKKK